MTLIFFSDFDFEMKFLRILFIRTVFWVIRQRFHWVSSVKKPGSDKSQRLWLVKCRHRLGSNFTNMFFTFLDSAIDDILDRR